MSTSPKSSLGLCRKRSRTSMETKDTLVDILPDSAPTVAHSAWLKALQSCPIVSGLEDLAAACEGQKKNGTSTGSSPKESPKRTNSSSGDSVDTTSANTSNNVPEFLCTHHGGFHCDEALALAMIKVLPEYQDMPIVRTRNMDIIKQSKMVVDVGGEYDEERLRFDHHMGDFTTTYSPNHNVTKLSSAGLIYKHFASAILKHMASEFENEPVTDESLLQTLVLKLYRNFIEEVDAIDNGVEPAENLKYRVSSGLGSRVKRCNPSWREENVTPAQENARFRKAMLVCAEEFEAQVRGLVREWYPARKIVESSLKETLALKAGDPTRSKVMILEKCCPWQEHLMDIEQEWGVDEHDKLLYVIFPDSRSKTFRIQAVPVTRGSFVNRKPLPKPWRGVRDDDLSTVTQIPGGVFVHASGFIGGNATLEGALQMARAAVEFPVESN